MVSVYFMFKEEVLLERIFSLKKILVFILFMAIMVLIISVFSLYSNDKVTIVDGILVKAGAYI